MTNQIKAELLNMTNFFNAIKVVEVENGIEFKTTDEVVDGIYDIVYRYEIRGNELYLCMNCDGVEEKYTFNCDLDDDTLLNCMINLWNENMDLSMYDEEDFDFEFDA